MVMKFNRSLFGFLTSILGLLSFIFPKVSLATTYGMTFSTYGRILIVVFLFNTAFFVVFLFIFLVTNIVAILNRNKKNRPLGRMAKLVRGPKLLLISIIIFVILYFVYMYANDFIPGEGNIFYKMVKTSCFGADCF